jgi:carboxyl-terminal processing protease
VTPLPPGQGALKITTALFFRPGGRSTQNDGVAADVVIPSLLSSEDFGEKTQPYALSGERIAPFLSSYANAIGPSDRWSGVSPPKLAELAARSNARTLASEEFAEIRAKIEEARENDGMIRLADILKEREEAEAQNGSGGESPAADTAETVEDAAGEDAEEELSPQVEEALNVLVDLVALSRKGT